MSFSYNLRGAALFSTTEPAFIMVITFNFSQPDRHARCGHLIEV